MSGRNDPRAATVVIGGVRLDATGITVTHPLDDETRRRIEAAPVDVYRRATGHAVRGTVEIAMTAEQTTAFLRMIGNMRSWRGCFHEGCDAADGEEGGTHWCRWAT